VSPENLTVMRTWIEAYNRGDMEALLAVTHPDFEFRTSGIFPGIDPVYKGHAGYKRFFGDLNDMWESFGVSVAELRDCGQRALLLGVFEGRGRDGLEVRRPTASIWTFRDDQVLQLQTYATWDEALEAVG
jgi:ketosteroid isomerase-like protein